MHKQMSSSLLRMPNSDTDSFHDELTEPMQAKVRSHTGDESVKTMPDRGDSRAVVVAAHSITDAWHTEDDDEMPAAVSITSSGGGHHLVGNAVSSAQQHQNRTQQVQGPSRATHHAAATTTAMHQSRMPATKSCDGKTNNPLVTATKTSENVHTPSDGAQRVRTLIHRYNAASDDVEDAHNHTTEALSMQRDQQLSKKLRQHKPEETKQPHSKDVSSHYVKPTSSRSPPQHTIVSISTPRTQRDASLISSANHTLAPPHGESILTSTNTNLLPTSHAHQRILPTTPAANFFRKTTVAAASTAAATTAQPSNSETAGCATATRLLPPVTQASSVSHAQHTTVTTPETEEISSERAQQSAQRTSARAVKLRNGDTTADGVTMHAPVRSCAIRAVALVDDVEHASASHAVTLINGEVCAVDDVLLLPASTATSTTTPTAALAAVRSVGPLAEVADWVLRGHNVSLLVVYESKSQLERCCHAVTAWLQCIADALQQTAQSNSGNVLELSASAIAFPLVTTQRDLLCPVTEALVQPCQLGTHPTAGPCVLGVRRAKLCTCEDMSTFVHAVCDGVQQTDEVAMALLWLKQIRQSHSARLLLPSHDDDNDTSAHTHGKAPQVYMSSVFIAFVRNVDATYMQPAMDGGCGGRGALAPLFANAIGGASAAVVLVPTGGYSNALSQQRVFARVCALRAVHNTAPRSGNIGRFVKHTRALLKAMATTRASAVGDTASAVQKQELHKMRLVLRDAQAFLQDAAHQQPVVYPLLPAPVAPAVGPAVTAAAVTDPAQEQQQPPPQPFRMHCVVAVNCGDARLHGYASGGVDEHAELIDTDDAATEDIRRVSGRVVSALQQPIDEVVAYTSTQNVSASRLVTSTAELLCSAHNVALVSAETTQARPLRLRYTWAVVTAILSTVLSRNVKSSGAYKAVTKDANDEAATHASNATQYEVQLFFDVVQRERLLCDLLHDPSPWGTSSDIAATRNDSGNMSGVSTRISFTQNSSANHDDAEGTDDIGSTGDTKNGANSRSRHGSVMSERSDADACVSAPLVTAVSPLYGCRVYNTSCVTVQNRSQLHHHMRHALARARLHMHKADAVLVLTAVIKQYCSRCRSGSSGSAKSVCSDAEQDVFVSSLFVMSASHTSVLRDIAHTSLLGSPALFRHVISEWCTTVVLLACTRAEWVAAEHEEMGAVRGYLGDLQLFLRAPRVASARRSVAMLVKHANAMSPVPPHVTADLPSADSTMNSTHLHEGWPCAPYNYRRALIIADHTAFLAAPRARDVPVYIVRNASTLSLPAPEGDGHDTLLEAVAACLAGNAIDTLIVVVTDTEREAATTSPQRTLHRLSWNDRAVHVDDVVCMPGVILTMQNAKLRTRCARKLIQCTLSGANAALLVADSADGVVAHVLCQQAARTLLRAVPASCEVYWSVVHGSVDGSYSDLLQPDATRAAATSVAVSPVFGPVLQGSLHVCGGSIEQSGVNSARLVGESDTASLSSGSLVQGDTTATRCAMVKQTLRDAIAQRERVGGMIAVTFVLKLLQADGNVWMPSLLLLVGASDGSDWTNACRRDACSSVLLQHALGGACYTMVGAGVAPGVNERSTAALLKVMQELSGRENAMLRIASVRHLLQSINAHIEQLDAQLRICRRTHGDSSALSLQLEQLHAMARDAEDMLAEPTGKVPTAYLFSSSASIT